MSEESGMMIVNLLIQVFYAIYLLFIIAVPIALGTWFWKSWLKYIRIQFLAKQEHILLEFRMPKEITKSPLAMEVFLTALFQTGSESTWWAKYWNGGMRPWFSLEMVSLEGQVHFFIWTRKGLQKTIETQLYSQYPDVEVAVVDDYTNDFDFDPDKNNLYGVYFKKGKESYYPIKTYVDFGLDKDPKEELKIDPITPVIEFLGSIGEGEQIWIQIMIRAHKKEMKKPGSREKTDWKHFAEEEIAKKMKRNKGEGEAADRLTKGEKQAIEAVEKTISKFAFDVGMRGIYLARKDKFNGANIGPLRGVFRQYSTNNLNSIAPTDGTDFDFPWQDIFNIRLNYKKKAIVKYYKQRAYFRPAHHISLAEQFLQDRYSVKYSIYNVEELASIYHFPGRVAKTPNFARIPSKKMDAPPNLPI